MAVLAEAIGSLLVELAGVCTPAAGVLGLPSRQQVSAWLDTLAASRFEDEVSYFLKKRVAAIDSLIREITHVLANR